MANPLLSALKKNNEKGSSNASSEMVSYPTVVQKAKNFIKEVKQGMVELYVVMVQRGLKTIEQVPVRYRQQVIELLAAVEE